MDKKKRNIIKGGTAAIITTIPARSVWGNGTIRQVSGNLSGNLSFPTQNEFAEMSGKSSGYWKRHYVGCSPQHFKDDKKHGQVLKRKYKDHKDKFYFKTSWDKSYSDITIYDYIGNHTYYDALYSSDPFIVQIATAKLNASIAEIKYPYEEDIIDQIYLLVMNGEMRSDDITRILEKVHNEY